MKTTGADPTEVCAPPRLTKFSLAANYDLNLIPALATYQVDEVYCRFPTDGVSSAARTTFRHCSRKPICGVSHAVISRHW
jgi:hypothetical protein